MSGLRCKSCGVFVRNDTEPSCWRVRVGYKGQVDKSNRQNPRSEYNYWGPRILCPGCGPDGRVWVPVTPDEVARRRGAGWSPERPYRQFERAS